MTANATAIAGTVVTAYAKITITRPRTDDTLRSALGVRPRTPDKAISSVRDRMNDGWVGDFATRSGLGHQDHQMQASPRPNVSPSRMPAITDRPTAQPGRNQHARSALREGDIPAHERDPHAAG